MVQNTVQKAIENFEQASTGETIKTSLVDLIETLNSVGGNTLLLGGHQQNYYVLEREVIEIQNTIYMQFLQYDTEPTEGSVNLLKNKDFYTYFVTNTLKKLQSINGDSSGKVKTTPLEEGDIGYNIKETLVVLNNTIWNDGSYNLKDAINAHLSNDNDKIKDTDSFMDFATALNKVKYGRVMVTPLNADTNKTYEAEENCAWNPVVVKLKLKGYDAIATENGDIDLPEGYDGFSSVDVKVPGGDGSGGSGTGGRSGELGNGGEPNVGPTTINENGEYNARNYQLDGFSSVSVNVKKFELPDDKTYTVRFVNHDGTLLWERKEVAPGSNVFYEGSPNPPVYKDDGNGNEICDEFWTFSGWDPMPINVLCDLTCTAKYSNWNPSSGNPAKQPFRYTNETWEDIIKNGGDNVDIGDVKILKIDGYHLLRMRKVFGATKAHDANSVWISLDTITIPEADNKDWGSCNVRTYLQGEFFNSLPDFIKNAIAPMSKIQLTRCAYAASQYPNGPNSSQWGTGNLPPVEPPSIAGMEFSSTSGDTIWLPSLHELNLLNDRDNGEFALNQNGNGAPYSLGNSSWNIANKDAKSWKEYHYPKNSYFGLIYTGAGANFGGDIYGGVYKYFKYAQGYRSFITNLAKSSEYRDCDLMPAIRKQLPHIKRTVPGGDDSKSLTWDSLSYATQLANQASEPPLDLYKILQEWDNYIPNIGFDGETQKGYMTSGIAYMAFKNIPLRDVYLKNANYKYTQGSGWTFADPNTPPTYYRAGTNGFGFPSNGSTGGHTSAIIGFGLK